MNKFINLPKQDILNLDKMVRVRAGQVASMALSDSDYAQISLFSFDGGEGVSDEVYPGDTLYYVISGAPVVSIDDQRHTVSEKCGMAVAAGVPHALESDHPFQLLQIMLNKETQAQDVTKSSFEHLQYAAVLPLKEQVGYENSQVVSLTLTRRAQVGMTLFAFDTGTGIGPHAAPGDAMVLVLDGETAVTIGDQTYTVKADESIVMPAGVPHALKAVKPFKMLLIVMHPDADA